MNSNAHLTEQQLYDLVIAGSTENPPELKPLREHLLRCPECAAELASLREPLEDFRSSVTAWASHHSAGHSWTRASRSTSFGMLSAWLLAAAALILLIALPFATHHNSARIATRDVTHSTPHPSASSSTTSGDEALLEEVNQTVSSSIPTPMQPLADPTAADGSKTDSNSRN
ncbi:MAG TPA: hypothetical protein VFS41_10020 [Edaphobacter sp.]|nr:hypothetical protein [Edaphobacter sp.]